jgi:hypothetical protein
MRRPQAGLTLVIVLIMLVVVSLLVVSAIRFGNINLKISGNVQSEAEAAAAAQVAVESTVKAMIAAPNMAAIAAQPAVTVSTGGRDYQVSVSKPGCVFTRNISTTELDPTKASDQVCFESSDGDRSQTSGGALTSSSSACKDQNWEVNASLDDSAQSGAKVTVAQGVKTRVGAEVSCP